MNEFAQRITMLRKARALTQDQLAQELGITAQAVSKWENGQSYPDITLLPKLAEVYGVRVDELLGCAPEKDEDEHEEAALDLPWDDDPKTIHAVLFAGHTLIGAQEVTKCPEASRITFTYEGEALNIDSVFAVSVDGEVQGNVRAGSSVSCDDVGGDVKAGGSVNCDAIGGNVSSGGSVNCDDVEGSVSANGSVTCGDVGGSVTAGGSLSCDEVHGSASAGGRTNSRSAGKGKKNRRSFTFSFDGKKFDTRQLERTMNEFGQKMGELGRELGEQVSKQVGNAFDSAQDDGDYEDLDDTEKTEE